jgi:PTS system nitrogen regulatory IIA component
LQLTVRQVSQFLSVSESTITRWIKHRALPAQYVGGQYRFNRAELLDWATANQVKVSTEMLDHPETEEEPVPSLAEALEAGGIFYQIQDTSKDRALRAPAALSGARSRSDHSHRRGCRPAARAQSHRAQRHPADDNALLPGAAH